MYEEDDITVEENKAILAYHNSIQNVFEQGDMIEKVIAKIRADPSENVAWLSWEKYHQHKESSRFLFYSIDGKIDTIHKDISILEYFEIVYPSPPETIKQFFLLENKESEEEKITPREFDGLCEYYYLLREIASMAGSNGREKIREIISVSAIARSRFLLESTKGKIEIIRQGMDILKSFGIGFPPPPNVIRRFFLSTDE